MAKPIVCTIDSYIFEFYHLSPKVALRVLARLAKMVGEPIGSVVDVVVKGAGGKLSLASIMQIDTSTLPPDLIKNAVSALVNRLDEDEILQTVETLLERVMTQGPEDKGPRRTLFENDFTGKLPLLFKVIAKSLEVNFGDFLGANTGLESR